MAKACRLLTTAQNQAESKTVVLNWFGVQAYKNQIASNKQITRKNPPYGGFFLPLSREQFNFTRLNPPD
jgi:hypothetical protein